MPAKTGEVWEGDSGWTVVIVEADEDEDMSFGLHRIRTIVAPAGVSLAECPTEIAEYHRDGGLAAAGWVRLA